MRRATSKTRQLRPAKPRKPRTSVEDRFNQLLSREQPRVILVVKKRYPMMDPSIVEEGVQEAAFQFWKRLKARRQLHQAGKNIGLFVTMAKQEALRLACQRNGLTSLDELNNEPTVGDADRPDYQYYSAECDRLRGRLLPVIAAALEPELLGSLKQFACDLDCSKPEEVFDFLYGFLFKGELSCPTPRSHFMRRLCCTLRKKRNTVDKALSRARQQYLSAIAVAS